MGSKILKIRNICFVVMALESILLLGIYFLSENAIILILAIYVTLKNIIVAMVVGYVGLLMIESTYETSQAVGVDTSKALIFGGIGLLRYDENRYITWTSELFSALNIKLVGVKLLEWQPLLASLFEDESIKLVDIRGKKYETYLSKESRTIFFKDVSQYVSLEQDFDDQQVCFAYITIDNYEEAIQNLDEQTSSKIQSKTREMLVDWACKNGMIIRRYKSGGYIAFFNERGYLKILDTNFSILDDFRKLSDDIDQVMTLSIGIGRDTRVLRELDELASSAINLTYSRGGNQVCVKSGDGTVKYFGGKTDSNEKTNKIRARVIVQSLQGAIKRATKVYIVGHSTTDLDSFGASIGMARLVQSCNKKANIVLDYNSIESKTGKAAKTFSEIDENKGLIIDPLEAIESANSRTLLILVDHNNPKLVLSSPLVDRVKNRIVIDHHRRADSFIETPMMSYLESSASSTVELVMELIDYANNEVHLSNNDATIMYAGLLMDTNNFKYRVGVRTFNAASRLRGYNAQINDAEEMLEDDYEEIRRKIELIQDAYHYNDYIIIACSDKEYQRPTIAKACNVLLEASEIKAAFVLAKENANTVAISARSTADVNVQLIMESIGGGGHFSMSAAQLKDTTVEEARVLLESKIKEYLDNQGE